MISGACGLQGVGIDKADECGVVRLSTSILVTDKRSFPCKHRRVIVVTILNFPWELECPGTATEFITSESIPITRREQPS